MKRISLLLLLLITAAGGYAQSISFYDLTNLTNLTDGEAHTYLTLGKVFKQQYVEEVGGKRLERFTTINNKVKPQNITIGVKEILSNGTVLHTVTYETFDPQHIVNMIGQAKRAKLIMKFQGVDANNNIYLFDNDFYSVAMYISVKDSRGLVKINQKDFTSN
ncbi:hypothetical protein FPZ43_14790 [Mucilaginibacter pallidiroseus]|uniref:DUF4252 domain-containing protein n=1 Tax=Mucilaginibacter pallidiroseus TaxID=2599295 RepID=A0A563U514_9SPHI|nr:hypothetical protein [Mucilaginibacter pallidiroseus]TWR26427.1 hypothetical protein FPZ43_14790 [Mucilaginibacter pallidiroseus]